MKRALLSVAAIVLFVPAALHSTVPEFVWTGSGSSDSLTLSTNWRDGTAPSFGGGELLRFEASRQNFVSVPDVTIHGLRVFNHFHFKGNETTLTLGAGGLEFGASDSSTHLAFEQFLAVSLTEAQTWTIANGSVEVRGPLSGTGNLTKSGQGRLALFNGNSGYSGNITLEAGGLEIVGDASTGANTALGTGTLTIGAPLSALNPPMLIARDENDNEDAALQLNNNIVVNGALATKNKVELTLAGTVTLNTDTTFSASGEWLVIEGAVSEATPGKKLTIDASGVIVLVGSSGWTGGTQVTKGLLIFAGDDNTPGSANGITIGSLGYAGITIGQNVGLFLGEVNKAASAGTIGFDSDPEFAQSTFNGTAEAPLAIDLTGAHSSLRLGSATQAILGPHATITPQGSDYRFGGGGGILTVASQLTGARNLVLDSPDQLPLTVRLLNQTNNFSGNVSVTNSALVFTDNQTEGSSALPVGTFSMNSASYIGHEDPHLATATFFAKFAANTPGIIGFDLAPSNSATITREVNLTGAPTLTGNGYLGTSSFAFSPALGEITGPGVRFTGTIAPNSDSIHRFAAYKGGALEVAGTLTGTALIIGQPDSLGAFGDRMRELYSIVLVSGHNGSGLAGGTTFYGGRLIIGQDASDGTVGTTPTHALGSGTLTVAPVTFQLEGEDDLPAPLLSAAQAGIIVPNNIVLSTETDVGGDHSFTLAGNISGSGELYAGEETESAFTLTLSGSNSFSGGVHVNQDTTVNAASNTALGTGPLSFGFPSSTSTPTVNFTTSAPVIGGLSSNEYALLNLTQAGTVLTVNQPSSVEYGNTFVGLIDAAGQSARLVLNGPGLLQLDGRNDESDYGFSGTGTPEATLSGTPNVLLEVRNGTLALGPDFTLTNTSSAIWINGGAFAVGDNVYLSNPVLVTAGAVAGRGTLTSAAIGANAKLAPGFDDAHGRIGTLTVGHVKFAPDSIYEWDIASADLDSNGQRDLLQIGIATTLEIAATSADPWVIRPVTLTSSGVNGILSDLVPGEFYSWTLISYQSVTGLTTLLDPANVRLDPAAWQANVAGTFQLEFTNLSGSGELRLNFSAVPEPSTYALLALGLGFVGLVAWRRRRPS